jgi:2-iminobutanoate/2-iminopropanoate deaminase
MKPQWAAISRSTKFNASLPNGDIGLEKSFVQGTWQQKRSFSPAVITKGAQTIVWVAGHTGASADDGSSLAGDFDAQFRQVFSNIAKTLSEAGCMLTDIVSMTVFLIDARYTTRMTELRTELFSEGDFPASAAISVTGFARQGIMLEIQCVAVRP